MSLPLTADVLIVGAGPAGLSAAAVLAKAGHKTVILDREDQAGGIPRHCGHSLYGLREFRRVMGGATYAKRLVERATQAGATLCTGVTVTALEAGGKVVVSTAEGVQTLQGRAVLLATGARETSRAARLIGGVKPGGVLNTGALQGLVYLEKSKPFRRPVILGTELVSFSALLTCRHIGAQVRAMIEPAARLTTWRSAALLPKALGVPLYKNTRITAIHGSAWVEGVTLSDGSETWDLDCDGVVITGGFRPENALLRAGPLEVDPGTRGPVVDQFGRCSDPSYFAAGNLLRPVETAPWCWTEGRQVAEAIHTALSAGLPDPDAGQALPCDDPAIAWTLPQRLVPGNTPAALPQMQLGLARRVEGTLRFGGGSAALRSRPARRVLVPLPRQADPLTLEEQT